MTPGSSTRRTKLSLVTMWRPHLFLRAGQPGRVAPGPRRVVAPVTRTRAASNDSFGRVSATRRTIATAGWRVCQTSPRLNTLPRARSLTAARTGDGNGDVALTSEAVTVVAAQERAHLLCPDRRKQSPARSASEVEPEVMERRALAVATKRMLRSAAESQARVTASRQSVAPS
jgi:hypothetical protein